MGDHKVKIHGGPNFNYLELGGGIPCEYECIKLGDKNYADPKFGR
jgi:hypothetical protein